MTYGFMATGMNDTRMDELVSGPSEAQASFLLSRRLRDVEKVKVEIENPWNFVGAGSCFSAATV